MNNEKNNYRIILTFIVIGLVVFFLGHSNTDTETKHSSGYDNSRISEYGCTDDCSGHEAGYEWAADKDICDPDYDSSHSESFNEGVRAYAEDSEYCNDDSGDYYEMNYY